MGRPEHDASKETVGFSRLMAVDSNWQQVPAVTVILLDEQAGSKGDVVRLAVDTMICNGQTDWCIYCNRHTCTGASAALLPYQHGHGTLKSEAKDKLTILMKIIHSFPDSPTSDETNHHNNSQRLCHGHVPAIKWWLLATAPKD